MWPWSVLTQCSKTWTSAAWLLRKMAKAGIRLSSCKVRGNAMGGGWLKVASLGHPRHTALSQTAFQLNHLFCFNSKYSNRLREKPTVFNLALELIYRHAVKIMLNPFIFNGSKQVTSSHPTHPPISNSGPSLPPGRMAHFVPSDQPVLVSSSRLKSPIGNIFVNSLSTQAVLQKGVSMAT